MFYTDRYSIPLPDLNQANMGYTQYFGVGEPRSEEFKERNIVPTCSPD